MQGLTYTPERAILEIHHDWEGQKGSQGSTRLRKEGNLDPLHRGNEYAHIEMSSFREGNIIILSPQRHFKELYPFLVFEITFHRHVRLKPRLETLLPGT
jgi:hypothetical protein